MTYWMKALNNEAKIKVMNRNRNIGLKQMTM